MLKQITFRILAIIMGLAAPVVTAEIILRFLPVNQGLNRLTVNEQNPVIRFEPNRTSTWSDSWNLTPHNTVYVNNYGFVNDRDYDPQATSPLLAVIGDSYVEAAMVPFQETLQGRLGKAAATKGRVYSFGASGSGLSTYLAYAKYVKETFKPQGMVFVIIKNDFPESLAKYEVTPSYHYFFESESGELTLKRVDYGPSFLRKLIRKSALAMYLITNVGIHRNIHIPLMLGRNDAINHIKGEVDVPQNDVDYVKDTQKGTLAFFDHLPELSELEPSKILFVIDGVRPALYEPDKPIDKNDAYFDKMRKFFMAEAKSRGYAVVDLDVAFRQNFARTGQRFEFPTDSHWSGTGHGVAAEEIQKTELFQKIFTDDLQPSEPR